MLKLEDRCKTLPKLITLEAEVPVVVPVLDADGNDTGKKEQSHETERIVLPLRLVLPGVGWSPLAIETGNRIAQAIDITAAGMVADGTLATDEEARRTVTLSFLPQIFTLYYVGEKELVFIASRQQEKITAFQHAIYPLTDEQEADMLADFFGYCRRYKSTSPTSSTPDSETVSTPKKKSGGG